MNYGLLAFAATSFDVFLMMNQNLEFQKNLATLPAAVLFIEAASNRIETPAPLVPDFLRELDHMQLRTLRRVKHHPGSV